MATAQETAERTVADDPAFGAFALPRGLEALRRAGAALPPTGAARRVASLIRRVCLLGRADPVDVEAFPGQRARLHPRDNLSEKRVFGAPQFWDAAEREALARAMRESAAPFHFVDAGANAGLYALAVRSLGPARILAVEPEPEMLRRLRVNLALSGAEDVIVAPVALAAEEGTVRLAVSERNRGATGIAAGAEGPEAPARPLLALLREQGFERVDALKIDIEGAEEPVLCAFLRDAPPALRPRLVILEALRGADTPALALLARAGYQTLDRTRMNAILIAGPEILADSSLEDTDLADGKA